MSELSRLKEQNYVLRDRLQRTALRSPVDGIVKQIHVTTQGGVVDAGMPLMEILPYYLADGI